MPPYENIEVTGWPTHCFSRGELLVKDGRYLDPPKGRGIFLKAGKPVF
jgi:dihydropyrimidinase